MHKNGIREQFRTGFDSLRRANRLIFSRKGFMKYFFISGLINVFLIVFFIWGAYVSSGFFIDKLSLWLNVEELFFIFKILIKVIIMAGVLLLYLLIYKNLTIVLMSPFLALLSEKTEYCVTGKEYPFSLKQIIKDVLRAVKMSLRNLLWELTGTLLLMLFLWVPVINIAVPVFIFLLQGYYLGFSLFDFTLERHRYNVKESAAFVRKNRWQSLFHGIIFFLILMIPVLGILAAPVYGVTAATCGVLAFEKKIMPG